ncbi:hypothetical protein Tfer_0676 [Thermincola ferriacetica]|uniref:DUF4912 domain-containing protein n=1 Tax=Thermincola ferriacetica TaxID=281456 RepID=A0A0L6W5X1_9FIRM|nr:DUF4912 domain-containing protein [Thermincola ferriacetica]KNZ70494.1 hypothetical protein Tfer_0676 [Thermincola ferriacetica]
MLSHSTDSYFPHNYNKNHLVLLIRDPYCLFAYWEFSEKQRSVLAEEYNCSWGEVPLIMRVYDVTGINFNGRNAHSYFDIAIHAMADNWYLHHMKANTSYCVDLGVITPDGRFITILRSNTVTTPRDSLADGSGLVWADLLDRSELVKVETLSSYNLFKKVNLESNAQSVP